MNQGCFVQLMAGLDPTAVQEENGPAWRIVDAFYDCLVVAVALVGGLGWWRFCDTIAPAEPTRVAREAVENFVATRSLLDQPEVDGPKEMLRQGMDIASRLGSLMASWDGRAEPPRAIATLAQDLLTSQGILSASL